MKNLCIKMAVAIAAISGYSNLQASVPLNAHFEMAQLVKERILWGAPISPYVRLVLVTLYEKNIPFTHKKVMPAVFLKAQNEKVDENFLRCSPFGKIPAYEETFDKGEPFCLTESVAISDYLDATIKAHPLRPVDPKANARVSYFLSYANSPLADATHAVLFEKVVKPHLKQATDIAKVEGILNKDLPAVLDYLETTLSDGRNWIAATEEISLADIAIVSHLVTLDHTNTKEISAAQAIGNLRPSLKAYFEKIIARPSFKKALEGL